MTVAFGKKEVENIISVASSSGGSVQNNSFFHYKPSLKIIKTLPLMARLFFVGAGDRGRTGTVSLPLDFESSTSANSITPAFM